MAGLGQEFTRSSVGESLEQIDQVGRPLLKLLQRHPTNGVTHPKAILVTLDQIENFFRGWSIALVGHLLQDGSIGLGVKVKWISVKHGVTTQPKRLMHLEIKNNACHRGESVVAIRNRARCPQHTQNPRKLGLINALFCVDESNHACR